MFFNLLLVILLSLLVVMIPNIEEKNKFRLNMICNGLLNKLLLLLLLVFIIIYDYKVGLVALLLLFSILYMDNSNMYEGFVSYFEKK